MSDKWSSSNAKYQVRRTVERGAEVELAMEFFKVKNFPELVDRLLLEVRRFYGY